MPDMLENIIISAVADPKTRDVTLRWANGATSIAHFAHRSGKGVFVALADNAIFQRVFIGPHGRSLAWPGDIDFCADALWFEANPADASHELGQAAQS